MTKICLQAAMIKRLHDPVKYAVNDLSYKPLAVPNTLLDGSQQQEIEDLVSKMGTVNIDLQGSRRLNAIIGNANRIFSEMRSVGKTELIPYVSVAAKQRYADVGSNIEFYASRAYQG